MSTVSVSYTLSPPDLGAEATPSLVPAGVHTFAVEADKTANPGAYYEALRRSIIAAKEKLGEELTAWRDAVGNAEVGKEKAVKATQAEEDDEEEEEE